MEKHICPGCSQPMTPIGRTDTTPFMLTDYICENKSCWAYSDIKKMGCWKKVEESNNNLKEDEI